MTKIGDDRAGGSERVLFVQYAGDFLAAHHLREATGEETYFGHGYVLDTLASLQSVTDQVGLISCITDSTYSERLPNGVVLMGAGVNPDNDPEGIIDLIEDFAPTHVVLLAPMRKIVAHTVAMRVRVLCLFADSFDERSPRHRFRHWRLRLLLNSNRVEWVANHGRNACASLRNIGVHPSKILPWDWPHTRGPADYTPKSLPPDPQIHVFLAGHLSRPKGVGDAIRAIKHLEARGVNAELTIAGNGEIERFTSMVRKLEIEDRVHFLGRVPNSTVFAQMRNATAVLVPSHHSYPEGLPLTIYEGLTARTPLIASDHPMFAGILIDQESALVHKAADPDALADCIVRLHSDAALYANLSQNAVRTWEMMQIPVTWGELVQRWVHDRDADRQWLGQQVTALT